jgi:hypothetical protein|tara:strand:+ start:89 stop:238 length:150 start_codon:yes stop_codon:yes gene_type:complete
MGKNLMEMSIAELEQYEYDLTDKKLAIDEVLDEVATIIQYKQGEVSENS